MCSGPAGSARSVEEGDSHGDKGKQHAKDEEARAIEDDDHMDLGEDVTV